MQVSFDCARFYAPQVRRFRLRAKDRGDVESGLTRAAAAV